MLKAALAAVRNPSAVSRAVGAEETVHHWSRRCRSCEGFCIKLVIMSVFGLSLLMPDDFVMKKIIAQEM
jgi:hypothetical protein